MLPIEFRTYFSGSSEVLTCGPFAGRISSANGSSFNQPLLFMIKHPEPDRH